MHRRGNNHLQGAFWRTEGVDGAVVPEVLPKLPWLCLLPACRFGCDGCREGRSRQEQGLGRGRLGSRRRRGEGKKQ